MNKVADALGFVVAFVMVVSIAVGLALGCIIAVGCLYHLLILVLGL
jgi:hypothetical protein